MKVAYVTNSSERSGVGCRAWEIKKHIRTSGRDIKVYDFHFDGKRGLLSKEGRPIDWVTTGIGPMNNKSVNWLRLSRRWKQYLRNKDKQEYNVWHITNQSLSFLARHSLKPTIVTVHDIIELTDPQQGRAKYVNRYLLSGIRKADHVIAISNYTAQEIKKYFEIADEKISVIYNGVGKEWKPIEGYKDTIGYQALRKKLAVGESSKILLVVGSDHPRKNVKQAIDVLEILLKQGEQVLLLKVGEPGLREEREKLLAMIEKRGLREKIKFISGVSNEELNELYNISDVLLFPSTQEGFGLPLVEAMAAGLPIVAVRATATPEVVGQAALLGKPGDSTEMSRQVKDVLKQANLRNELVEKGKKRAGVFSWEKSAAAVMNIYERLV